MKQEIPISPFRIKVDPSHDAAKVRAEGPGLNKAGEPFHSQWHLVIYGNIICIMCPRHVLICLNPFISSHLFAGVEVGKPTHFNIYTKGAGKAIPEVFFSGAAKGEAVRDFEIIDNHDYSYTVRYTAVQQVTFTYG